MVILGPFRLLLMHKSSQDTNVSTKRLALMSNDPEPQQMPCQINTPGGC